MDTDDNIKAFFDNRISIHLKYFGKKYNNTRRYKWTSICCSFRAHEKIRNLPLKTQYEIINKTEHGCYIETYKKCIRKNIPPNWRNRLFVCKYSQITQRIQFNLENSNLIDKIISGELKAELLATYSNNILSPSSNHIYVEIEKRKQQKVIKKVCKGEICKMCGHDESTYILVQIRSLDEGQTMRYTCANESCGHRWEDGGS